MAKDKCRFCGKQAPEGRRSCVLCQLPATELGNRRVEKMRESGLCIQCGNPTDGTWRCRPCMDSNNLVREKRAKLVVGNGLCVLCAKRSYITTSSYKICEICYIKRASTKNMNSRKYWRQLLDLLEFQDYTCPYSGVKIILGQNDSIDHILPKSRFPELIDDISNIQWVTRLVNRMKWDATHEEFIENLKEIQAYYFPSCGV